MQDSFVVDIDVGVGWTLDFLFVDSEPSRKSFGQQSLPRAEFSVEEEYFVLLRKLFAELKHFFCGFNMMFHR